MAPAWVGQGSTPHSSSSGAVSSTPALPVLLWTHCDQGWALTQVVGRERCPEPPAGMNGCSEDQGLSWQQGCCRGAVQLLNPFPREQLLPMAEP